MARGGSALNEAKKKYSIKETIGSGSFGVVRKCIKRKTGKAYAIKTILKSKVDDVKVLEREVKILQEVDHPHIIKLYEVYQDSKYMHIVTELCTGGELYDRVIEKSQSPDKHYSELDAAQLLHDILSAIAYCHDVKHIAHRDLKCENFLLLNEDEHAPVKIIDFGLSRHHDSNPMGVMKSSVGTVYYVAPEVLECEYTCKCDIWSIGIIAYILLCGYAPFLGSSEPDTLRLVEAAEYSFPSPDWDDISDDAKDFVTHLLQKDPKDRPTAAKALTHPFIVQNLPKVQQQGRPRLLRVPSTLSHEGIRQNRFQRFLMNQRIKKQLKHALHIMSPHEAAEVLPILDRVMDEEDGALRSDDLFEIICGVDCLTDSVKEKLEKIRHVLSKNHGAFDISPYMKLVLRKANSDSIRSVDSGIHSLGSHSQDDHDHHDGRHSPKHHHRQ